MEDLLDAHGSGLGACPVFYSPLPWPHVVASSHPRLGELLKGRNFALISEPPPETNTVPGTKEVNKYMFDSLNDGMEECENKQEISFEF